ncbi:MAG: IPT/TIG domain-containing protein, partial [Bacteroidales bacterium]|nr:IPT/TIG domain-containing protein [Bacteroidales bacterium]
MNSKNKLINILAVAILLAAWFMYSECEPGVESIPDPLTLEAKFTISPENPIVGSSVTLDGSSSTGPINIWEWTVVLRPGEASTNQITNANEKIATFIPDLIGPYTIQLKVDKWDVPFNSKQLNFEAVEGVLADAGIDQYEDVGETITLDCSGSASSGPISAEWTLLSTPGLSSVTSVIDPSSFTPTFIMDEPGTYEVKLYVQLTDDITKFDSDIVLVVANPPEISFFSPTNGTAGTEVTITGKNYSSFPEGNIVKFNGLSAEITDASDITLTVIAPQGVTTGPITVGIEETAEEVVSDQDFIVAGTGFTTVVTGVEALWGVDFGNQSVGVAVGELGIILYTSDGGYTWNAAVSNTTQSLRAVSFATSSTAYAVGGLGGILKTTDGGSTWNTITTGTVSGMNAVSFLDENTG